MAGTVFDATRLAKKQGQLLAFDDMFDAFIANAGMQEYDLDTGQSRQTVRRADLTQMRLAYAKLEGDVAVLEARVCGTGVVRVGAAW